MHCLCSNLIVIFFERKFYCNFVDLGSQSCEFFRCCPLPLLSPSRFSLLNFEVSPIAQLVIIFSHFPAQSVLFDEQEYQSSD